MLSMLTLDDTEKWDRIVKSFQVYDVYYLSGYLKAFQIHGDGEPLLFFYEDEKIKAMNVVMKKDIADDGRFTDKIPRNTLFDIATPYGYGGFLIEGEACKENLRKLREEYVSLCGKEGIVSEFARIHPIINTAVRQIDLYDIAPLGRTVTIELHSQEHIWNKLKSNKKRKIKKATKAGVEIFWGRAPVLFEEFRILYNKTMDKNKAKDYYYFPKEFYQSVCLDLKHHSLIFYALYEEKIVAMSIVLFQGQQMHYHLSANDTEYQALAPNVLLLYEAACWGSENGYKTFHLGGGVGLQEDSLFAFKAGFNEGSHTYFSTGRKIFDEVHYHELVEMRKQELDFKEKSLFFPAYRQ